MEVSKDILNIETFTKLSAIFIPGILIILFLSSIDSKNGGNNILQIPNNAFIDGLVFIALTFLIGALIYISSTRVTSYFFKLIRWNNMNKSEDTGHRYWRHFFMSLNLTFFIIFFLMIIKLPPMLFLVILAIILSSWLTWTLHNDLRGKKEEKQEETTCFCQHLKKFIKEAWKV